MPSVEGVGYLIDFLWRVGPTMDSGMGRLPLSESELAAWQFNSGVRLSPWEAESLRRLSREYLGQSQQAEKHDCPAPYGIAQRREIVARKIDEIFG